MKTPIAEGPLNHWQVWMPCGTLLVSKQLQPAMTNQVYTISIKSRNQNALVSPMRCEYGLGLWQYIKKIVPKLRKCDLIPLKTAAKQDSKPNIGLQPNIATGFRQEQKLFLTASKHSHSHTTG